MHAYLVGYVVKRKTSNSENLKIMVAVIFESVMMSTVERQKCLYELCRVLRKQAIC